MKVLLLCGYRSKDQGEGAQSALVDQRIADLQALRANIVCVLSGPDSDDLLRSSKKIHDVEIVYDTNSPATLMTNARAGAFSAPGEALFILPLEIAVPPKSVWNFLKNEHGKVGFATEHTFLHSVSPEGAPYHYGFPLLLTVKGAKRLQSSPEFESFGDARLNSLALPISV